LSGLWAVHILDGILAWPWLLGGGLLAALLCWLGLRRLGEEEIPRIAVLSSAFFVATLIHVPTPLPTSIHLLLNGLVGIILGPRSAVAILLALFLQALLLGHGGLTTLGVNTCIMTIPALAAWGVFCWVRSRHGLNTTWSRWLTGFLLGGATVLFTAVLNSLTLWIGSSDTLEFLAWVVFVGHLPVAIAEAVIMGATVVFLGKVKPEMLGLKAPTPAALPQPPARAERQAG
jgi:cobalt/nickel transport system permease protein